MAVVFTSHGMFVPLVPLYALHLGATPAAVGAIVALAFLPSLFLAIPIGGAADRWGPVRLMRFGGAAIVVAPLALALIPTLWMLIVFQVVVGVAQLALVVGAQALVATFSTGRRRERDYGLYTTALSVGQAIGPLVAGAALDAFGFGAAFAAAAIVASAAWLIALWKIVDGARPLSGPATTGEMLSRLPSILRSHGVRVAMIASTAVLLGMVGVQAFLPVHLDALGLSATTIGVLFSIMAVASIVVRPFVASVSAGFGSRSRALIAVVFVVAGGLVAPAFADSLAMYVVLVVLVGLGAGVSQPLSMAMVIDHVVERERGLALGLRLTGNRAAQFLSPLLLGVVATAGDVRAVFPVAAALIGLMNLGAIAWAKRLDRTREHDEV